LSTTSNRRGSVTLEWVILVTVILLGTIGAVAAVRNSLLTEYAQILDTICELSVGP
jgi:hypothetical protein